MFDKAIKALIEIYESALKIEDKEQAMKHISEALETSSVQFSALFESSIKEKIDEQRQKLEEEYTKKVQLLEEEKNEKFVELEKKLNERLEVFVEYSAKEFVEKNEKQIISEARCLMVEDVYQTLKTVLGEKGIVYTEENTSLIESLNEEVKTLRTQLNESANKLIERDAQVKQLRKSEILNEAAKDLSMVERSQLKNLADGVQFDENYEQKIDSLVQLHFAKKETTSDVVVESSNENTDVINKDNVEENSYYRILS